MNNNSNCVDRLLQHDHSNVSHMRELNIIICHKTIKRRIKKSQHIQKYVTKFNMLL